MKRINVINTINLADNEKVKISGFVKKKRNLGELIFIDLRDITGIIQIVVHSKHQQYAIVKSLKNEDVIEVIGTIQKKAEPNRELLTGEIEIKLDTIQVIAHSKQTPLIIDNITDALEEVRLKYRYLDLRRPIMQDKIKMRHQIMKIMRNFLDEKHFLDIETPILSKSTPEGAQDFLVPKAEGDDTKFYALPQSPQIYKQLLMIAGFERYYQIARCFRNEDLRSDRQPEFTQLDIEMSYVSEHDIMNLVEDMLKKIMSQTLNIEILEDFPKIKYEDAMNQYGSDKPDTRYEIFLHDVKAIFSETEFKVFQNVEMIKAINVPLGENTYTRKKIDELEIYAKSLNAKGLPYVQYIDGSFNKGISKFLSSFEQTKLKSLLKIEENSIIFFAVGTQVECNHILGALRQKVAQDLNLIDQNKFNFLWIVDWPLFEYDEVEKRNFAMHHPFTKVKNDYTNPSEAIARAYDIVLNGYEIGGGSMRITNYDEQIKLFKNLGISEEKAKKEFGFLLEAYSYASPHHGGIALGLDRLVMILTNSESIREVIAFPKNSRGHDMMMDSPNFINDEDLEKINLR